MLHQAKMASLGRTAAGVAHEINNPLAFVTNNIAVLTAPRSPGLHEILLLYRRAEDTLALYQAELLGQIHDMADRMDLPFVLDNLDHLMERSRVRGCGGSRRSSPTSATSPTSKRPR